MQMPLRFAFALWPGTLAAWRYGDVRSMLIAVLFGAILSTAWVGTLIWPLWLSPWRLGMLWTVVSLSALVSLVHNGMHGLLLRAHSPKGCPDSLLAEAQSHYLKANYFEAEQLLAPYCSGREPDMEACLLLAGILRRSARYPQAIDLLDRLGRLDRAVFWMDEIEREKMRARQQRVHSHAESV